MTNEFWYRFSYLLYQSLLYLVSVGGCGRSLSRFFLTEFSWENSLRVSKKTQDSFSCRCACFTLQLLKCKLGKNDGDHWSCASCCSSLVFNSCSSATHSTQSTYHGDTRRMIVAGVGFVLPLVGIVSIYIRYVQEGGHRAPPQFWHNNKTFN